MRNKKSFGEWMLDIFAAVMVSLFPTLCVRKFTKKSNKNAKKFLPGAEKELKAIEKLELSAEELTARVWSKDTRIALIKKHNRALLNDVASAEELEALYESSTVVADIIKALRVYTPSKQLLLKMLRNKSYEQVMLRIAEIFPLQFNQLTAWEILGVKKDEPYKGASWDLACVLIEKLPRTWAVPFMMEVHKIAPRQRNEEALSIWKQAFEQAFKLKLDVSKLIVFMSVLNKEQYLRIVTHYDKYEDFSPYFKVLFGQLVKYLDGTSVTLATSDVQMFSDDTTDAYWRREAFRWLKIGYHLADNQSICDVILDNLKAIERRVDKGVFAQLCERISRAVTDGLIRKAFKLLPSVPEYRRNLLAQALTFDRYANTLEMFYPFTGMPEEMVNRAIDSLIEYDKFPVERMAELPADLQIDVFAKMEAQAQIKLIKSLPRNYFEEKKRLKAFQPEAELYLFKAGYSYYHQQKLAYNQLFKMSDWTFLQLMKDAYQDGVSDLIRAYVLRWGLSKELYTALLQSEIKSLAPEVKWYIGKDEAELAKEAEAKEQ